MASGPAASAQPERGDRRIVGNGGDCVIFAARDYWAYRRRRGRFARDGLNSLMAAAFDSELPPKALAILEPGDLIFVETFGSLLSWAVMYFTDSEVSHAAMYLGDGSITHATFSGVITEPVAALFGPDRRLLVCKPVIPDDLRPAVVKEAASHLGRPYGWYGVLRKAVRIITGRIWPLFRWRFALDFFAVLVVLELAAFLATHRIMGLTLLIVPYLLTVLGGWSLWKRRGCGTEDGTPDMLLHYFLANDAQIALDAYKISQEARRTK